MASVTYILTCQSHRGMRATGSGDFYVQRTTISLSVKTVSNFGRRCSYSADQLRAILGESKGGAVVPVHGSHSAEIWKAYDATGTDSVKQAGGRLTWLLRMTSPVPRVVAHIAGPDLLVAEDAKLWDLYSFQNLDPQFTLLREPMLDDPASFSRQSLRREPCELHPPVTEEDLISAHAQIRLLQRIDFCSSNKPRQDDSDT